MSIYIELRKLINAEDLKSRLIRTKLFIEYLIESERAEVENNTSLIQNEYVSNIFTSEIKNNFNKFVGKICKKDDSFIEAQYLIK